MNNSDEYSESDLDKTLPATGEQSEIETQHLPSPVEPESTIHDLASQTAQRLWSGFGEDDLEATLAQPRVFRENETTIASNLCIREQMLETEGVAKLASDAEFEVVNSLGEGGIGVVYLAKQRSMDRLVALKVLKPEQDSPAAQEAFVSEAVITGNLDHPNIVPVYDVGRQKGRSPFYAMKRVQGVEWADRIDLNSIPQNLEILLRVADALAFAHAKHIIHRDLKPANVMLGSFGEVLLMDWGLAMPTRQNPQFDLFPEPARGGTPAYMPPEMAIGAVDELGESSDIYLLGANLFRMITGKPPHSGKTVSRILSAAARNEIQPIVESGELIEIAQKAMATSPGDRFASIDKFKEAIQGYNSHAESRSLTQIAQQDFARAQESNEYEFYSRAIFGFVAAIKLWPENLAASEALNVARLAHANAARSRGDLELAATTLDQREPEQLRLWEILHADINERDARFRRINRLRMTAGVSVALVALLAVGSAIWIHFERNEAEYQKKVAVVEAGKALNAQHRAETAQTETQRLHIAEKKARTQADLARSKAEKAFVESLNSLNQLTTFSESLRDVPGLAVERARLLKHVSETYAKIAANAELDNELRFEGARGLMRYGDILLEQYEQEKAKSIFQDAIECLAQLPENDQVVVARIRAHCRLASTLWQLGDAQSAEQLQLADSKLKLDVDDADWHAVVADVAVTRALMESQVGNLDVAQSNYELALDRFDQLATLTESDGSTTGAERLDLLRRMATTKALYSQVLGDRGHLTENLKTREDIVLRRTSIVNLQAKSQTNRIQFDQEQLVDARVNLAQALIVLHRHTAAEKQLRQALDLVVSIEENSPVPSIDFVIRKAIICAVLAQTQAEMGHPFEPWYSQADELFSKLTGANKDTADWTDLVANDADILFRQASNWSVHGRALTEFAADKQQGEALLQVSQQVIAELHKKYPSTPYVTDGLCWTLLNTVEYQWNEDTWLNAIELRRQLANSKTESSSQSKYILGWMLVSADASRKSLSMFPSDIDIRWLMNGQFGNVVAAYEFRSGEFLNCIDSIGVSNTLLHRANAPNSDLDNEPIRSTNACDAFYLAMANWKLLDNESALKQFELGVELSRQAQCCREYASLRREAAKLLGVEDPLTCNTVSENAN
jgi:predicted Ser/Thr protein kinase